VITTLPSLASLEAGDQESAPFGSSNRVLGHRLHWPTMLFSCWPSVACRKEKARRVSRSGPEHASPAQTPYSNQDMIGTVLPSALRSDSGDGSQLGGRLIAGSVCDTWSWNPSFTISFAAASTSLNSGSRSSASLRKLLNSELFISRSLNRDRSASEEETCIAHGGCQGLWSYTCLRLVTSSGTSSKIPVPNRLMSSNQGLPAFCQLFTRVESFFRSRSPVD